MRVDQERYRWWTTMVKSASKVAPNRPQKSGKGPCIDPTRTGELVREASRLRPLIPKPLLLPLILVETADVAVHHVVVLFCVLLILLVARSELTLPPQLNRCSQVVRCRVDRMLGAVGRHLIMQAHDAG
jgi:hypothetical protein